LSTEKELWIPLLYWIPIAWSRIWLLEELRNWRKDQQDQVVQKTKLGPLFIIHKW
jgi:hypothetical protein